MTMDNSSETQTLDLAAGQNQVIVFELSGCLFGLDILQVLEIIRLVEMTLVPKTPAFLEGIIHLRGKIIPVMDLKKRFGLPLADYCQESRILIVQWQDQTMGFLVDKVLEAGRVFSKSVIPVKEPILDINPIYLEGLISWKGKTVLMIKLEKVFWAEKWKGNSEYEMNI